MDVRKQIIETNKDFPGQIIETPGGGIIAGTFNDIVNWARSNSLWPLTFATSCCGIEMMAVARNSVCIYL